MKSYAGISIKLYYQRWIFLITICLDYRCSSSSITYRLPSVIFLVVCLRCVQVSRSYQRPLRLAMSGRLGPISDAPFSWNGLLLVVGLLLVLEADVAPPGVIFRNVRRFVRSETIKWWLQPHPFSWVYIFFYLEIYFLHLQD